jgi:hypothetical protein
VRGADLPLAFPLPFPIGRRTIKAQILGNGKLRDIRSESTLTHIRRTRRSRKFVEISKASYSHHRGMVGIYCMLKSSSVFASVAL